MWCCEALAAKAWRPTAAAPAGPPGELSAITEFPIPADTDAFAAAAATTTDSSVALRVRDVTEWFRCLR